MMRTRSLLCALALGLLSAGLAVADDELYQWERDIQLPPLQETELVAVPLDAPIYAAIDYSLADIRVVNAQSVEVPFILDRPLAEESGARLVFIRPRIVSQTRHEDGSLELELERYASQPVPAGLRVTAAGSDFVRSVTVYAQTTDGAWRTLVENSLLVSSTRDPELNDNLVVLGPHDSRKLRIVIEPLDDSQQTRAHDLWSRLQGPEAPATFPDDSAFELADLDLWTTSPVMVRVHPAEIPLGPLPFVVDRSQQGLTRVEVETGNLPLLRVDLETPDKNFSRTVRVLTSASATGGHPWRSIGESQVTRLDFKNLQESQNSINTFGARSQKIRLEVVDRDSPPLEIAGLTGFGQVTQVVFFASPGDSLKLVYGSSQARAPAYDVVALRRAMGIGASHLTASLGPPREGAKLPIHRQQRWLRFISSPAALTTTVVLLVGLLAWILFRAGGRMAALERAAPPAKTTVSAD